MLQQLLQGLVAQTEAPASGGGGIMSFLPFIAIFAVMYFLIIRPQQKQAKKQAEFLTQLKKGDEVVLASGFFGRVFAVGDTDVTIELAPSNTKVRVLKSAVSGSSAQPQPAAPGSKTETDKKS